MPYANNNGVRIHYKVEGTGPPLVLIHGFLADLEYWRQLGYVEALKSSYRVILIDMRGHGQSDKPHEPAEYGETQRVGDILAVLDAEGVQRAHVWGYSKGGIDGFLLAHHAPERVASLITGGIAARSTASRPATIKLVEAGMPWSRRSPRARQWHPSPAAWPPTIRTPSWPARMPRGGRLRTFIPPSRPPASCMSGRMTCPTQPHRRRPGPCRMPRLWACPG